ncbi:hypothetical protein ACQ4M4_22760 [Leptolyngbya sp. AN02str]|uniref:hypothetical protein n=1 Tax=Leptolyngbya sp. AN02str TaxID=3423363 RepID=UPI003D316AB5
MPHAKRTPATDIYALVATLYTLLTAEAPTAAALRDRIPLVSPRHLQPHLSAAVEHAVLQGMAMEPGDRPSTVEAWLKLLPQLEPVSASADPVNILSQAVTLVVVPRALPSSKLLPCLGMERKCPHRFPLGLSAAGIPACGPYWRWCHCWRDMPCGMAQAACLQPPRMLLLAPSH